MCGILGVLHHKSCEMPDPDRLMTSARLLQHRGPDHQAIFADEGMGMVHTRLALLDLSPRSNQPFRDREDRYVLAYNGEIYNYRELRAELEALGVEFRTTSDTEVLLECLIHFGINATLPRLEGMFAFGLYDRVEHSLVVARDRFGIKPLHVYETEDIFVFASEIGAMRPWVPFRPDILSISSYLQGFGGPTQRCTFYEGVRIVPPGMGVNVVRGRPAHWHRFWGMSDFWDQAEVERLGQLKPNRLVDEMDALLFKSVRSQLVADAPVGLLCSGGVDSSLILAMAARIHNNLAIFHANVVGPNSEYAAAARLAKHLGLDLNTVDVDDEDSIDSLPEVIKHYGHPFTYHPNSVPFLLVSRLVRSKRVKAILSGEGADESYIGYPWLVFDLRGTILRSLLELPRVSWHLVRALLSGRHQRGLARACKDDATIVQGFLNRCETELEETETTTAVRRKSGREPTAHDVVTLNQLTYHLRSLLHRNDCLGMAASIEARFPYLDSSLVSTAVNMPYQYKVRFSPTTLERAHWFLRDKWVLRQVASRYLPPDLAQRKKNGFPISASSRMRIAPELLTNSFVAELYGLSQEDISCALQRANQGLKVKLLHLEVWARVCLADESMDTVRSHLKDHVAMDKSNRTVQHGNRDVPLQTASPSSS